MAPPAPAEPLRLTPFERYMLADHDAGELMVFELVLVFGGRVERAPLRAALLRAMGRHPLLGSVVVEERGGPRWEPTAASPQLTWDPEPPPAPLDVRRGPGLSARVEPGPELTRLRVRFHHTASDGLGGFQLLEDLLLAYHAEVTGQAVSLPPRAPEALRLRGEVSQRSRAPRGLRARWQALDTAWRFVAREPQRLTPRAGPDPVGYRLLDPLRLERGTVMALRGAARAQEVSLNDLLLRDLLLALGATLPPVSAPLRVMVPADLRDERHTHMPAANTVSIEAVERGRAELGDPAALLASVRRQTRGWREGDAGSLVRALPTALAVPGLLPAGLRRDYAYATLVCSNVGTVFPALPLPQRDGRWCVGEAELREVWGAPPVRRSTPAALGVISYAGELFLCLGHDPRRLPAPAAAALLQSLEAALLRSAGG